ncbi:hypothetical protein [Acinetobacter towneri]|uniref:hypothetical protein n=1 Tax=Acinetobacter towneri TaxID=202956 RepID=UPI003A83DDEF
MSMLFIQKTIKIDSIKTQKLLEKSCAIAAQRVGSMRGVFQGEMNTAVSASKLKNIA